MQADRRAPLAGGARFLLALTLAWSQACTTEQVLEVEVRDLSIEPPVVTVLEGDSVRLYARVTEADGGRLEGAVVQWSTDDPSIASIDAAGVVHGFNVGVTTARASSGGTENTAQVTVVRRSAFAAEPTLLAFHGAAGAASPGSKEVLIRNMTEASLEGLSVEVAYPAGTASSWLTTSLRTGVGGVVVTVTPDVSRMPPGEHTASLLVSVASTGDLGLAIPVVLTLDRGTIDDGGEISDGGGGGGDPDDGDDDEEDDDDKGKKGGGRDGDKHGNGRGGGKD